VSRRSLSCTITSVVNSNGIYTEKSIAQSSDAFFIAWLKVKSVVVISK
jgi:hypothetical protein